MKPKRKHITRAVKDAKAFIRKAQAIKGIPDDCRLPDSIDAIEAGRPRRLTQQALFDDSLMGRLRAVKGNETR